MSEAAARDVLAAAGLDDRVVLSPAGAGARNEVWVADEVVVRLLASPERLAMEAAIVAHVASTAGGEVPVASVLWWSSSPAALVQRRLPGERLSDVAVPSSALQADVVRVLRAIHAVGVEGRFGNLRLDLRGEDERLADWFVGRVEQEAAAVGADDAEVAAGLASLRAAVPLSTGSRRDSCTATSSRPTCWSTATG